MDKIDLIGLRFGRWTVLEEAEYSKRAHSTYWLCKCDCGTIRKVAGNLLKSGGSLSCGCFQREVASKRNSTHRKSKTRLYGVWASMRERCKCKTNSAYNFYGGRGIDVCEEWDDFSAFEYWALSNGYDEKAKTHQCTLDRIDNNKGYSPDNCRWVNSTVQSNNQRSNVLITFNGRTQTRAQWAKEKGWRYELIRDRIDRYGWSVERALTEPLHTEKGHRPE